MFYRRIILFIIFSLLRDLFFFKMYTILTHMTKRIKHIVSFFLLVQNHLLFSNLFTLVFRLKIIQLLFFSMTWLIIFLFLPEKFFLNEYSSFLWYVSTLVWENGVNKTLCPNLLCIQSSTNCAVATFSSHLNFLF